MAHYALLDESNIVTQVLTGVDEDISKIDLDGTQIGGSTQAWESFYGNLYGSVCKRTSRNTSGGIHLEGGTPFRFNYAGIGYTYDPIDDAFIAPKPYPSWVLNSKKQWEPPIAYPTDGKLYGWNEETGEWLETDPF